MKGENSVVRKFPLLHIVLFVLTFLSTLFVGAIHSGVDLLQEPVKIYEGFPFSFTLMTILLSHELAHYYMSKKHDVEATLPYFIPAPTIIGTFGAFIKMKSPIVSRRALIDIGASGPIAGFIVSVIATIVGLQMSEVVLAVQTEGALGLGDSLLFSFLSKAVLGITPSDHDIMLSPVAFAGWIGLFVTSMNLIPVGQLDGGHIAYALLGERHARISVLLVVVLGTLGLLLWEGWAIWALLLLLLGMKHPPVLYREAFLDVRRRFVGWLSLLIFIITFIPVPFRIL